MSQFLPVIIYFFAVIGFAAFSLVAPHLIAPRKKTVVKDMPYESGMDPVGDTRKPLDIKYYLIAILFLLFDVEMLLIIPYAVSFNSEDGLPLVFRPLVLSVVVFFLGTLSLAYAIAWRRGVFNWRTLRVLDRKNG